MRLSLITSKSAEYMVKRVIDSYKNDNIDLKVIALPVPVISILDTLTISRIIERRRNILEELMKSDIVILPGLVRGSSEEIERVVKRDVYKGPKSLGNLSYVLDFIEKGGKLDKLKSAEEVLGEITPRLEYKKAFSISGIDIPLRGPPVVLVTEIDPSIAVEKVEKVSKRYVSDGANILIIGSTINSRIMETVKKIRIAKKASVPVIVEATTRSQIESFLKEGIDGISIAAEDALKYIDYFPRGITLIIGSREFRYIKAAYESLSKRDINIIIDPVLGMPCLDFIESLNRYSKVSKNIGAPLLFSAADAVEEIEADTHGLHALLATMAVEIGASLYLVVEESYKSYRATAEAREALRVAETACSLKSSPRGLYSNLLILKQAKKPMEIQKKSAEIIGYIPPKYSSDEYVQINVDHEEKVIIVTYKKGGKEVFSLKGSHALSLARELIKRAYLSKEHIAYIGYELSKAEIALMLGKTYIQDEPIISVPWRSESNE